MANFPERLKALRNEKRYTQNEMAEIFGLKPRGYQEYEYGNAYPTANCISFAHGLKLGLRLERWALR